MTLNKLLAVLGVFKKLNNAGEQPIVVWDEHRQQWVAADKLEQVDGQLRLLPADGYTPPHLRSVPEEIA